MILAYLFMFKCYNFMYLYTNMCVCRHFHVVPLCSRHDLTTRNMSIGSTSR
uniref:Uncharacterized protein n=1 Tax=Brassica oleracea var. oleracea TaxID=109376 RepID=A0A0D3BJ06_BRAOL